MGIIFGLMFYFGASYPQPPFSDFEIHWKQSQNLDEYIKGGLSSLVYKLISVFLVEDWKSALFVNLISWVVFVSAVLPKSKPAVHEIDKNIFLSRFFVYSIFFYGIWWVSTSSTVAIFPMHLALFASGIKLALICDRRSRSSFVGAVFLLSFAFSMRMQTILALFLGGALILLYLSCKHLVMHRGSSKKRLVISRRFSVIILLSVGLGVIAELALRHNSSNFAEIQRSQRAQLYNGVFQPFSKQGHCGGWTQENWDLAMKEGDMPLPLLFQKYLNTKSINFYVDAVACKLNRFVNTKIYVWWTPRINYADPGDGALISHKRTVGKIIKYNNYLLKLCLLFLMIYLIVRRLENSSQEEHLLFSILLGMVIIFSALEFNSRYSFLFVGYFLIFFGLKNEKFIYENK